MGKTYNFTFFATGGQTPYGWSSGPLPVGLSLVTSPDTLSANLTRSPTNPLQSGVSNITIKVRDFSPDMQNDQVQVTLHMVPAPLVINDPGRLPDGKVGERYPSVTFTASGGVPAPGGAPPYVWSISPASGLSFDSNRLGGQPSSPFSGLATITVSDFINTHTSIQLNLHIAPASLVITNAPMSLPDGTVGAPYSGFTFTASGGVPPYGWSISPESGLSFDSNRLGGQPSSPFSGLATITVSDSINTHTSIQLNLHIVPIPLAITGPGGSILPAGFILPQGAVGVAYPGFPFSAPRALVHPVWSSDLPAASGLSVDSGRGTFGGTPALPEATTQIIISIADDFQPTPFKLPVLLNVLGITTASLPNVQAGAAYNPPILTSAGGKGSITWSLSVTPPLALGTTPDGQINGTPAKSGKYIVTVTAGDTAGGVSASRDFPLNVTVPFQLFNSGLAGDGAVDPNYTVTFNTDPPAAAFVVTQGTLPATGSEGTASKWIAPQADGLFLNLPGDYKFQAVFSLTGFDPATASVTGQLFSDNEGFVQLNGGVEQAVTALDFTIGAGFNPGVNTLVFRVHNDAGPPGSPNNPTGMRVEMVGLAVSTV